VTNLLVDTSVLVKWFHADGESDPASARAIRDANTRGQVRARIVDLALYEMGNVLLRALGWTATEVADQLDDLVVICGTPLAMSSEWLRRAAALGVEHHLTFYDAAWVAAAKALGVPLVSADSQLLAAGLAESAEITAQRLDLRVGS
jgi:predicted nucleic acid-binding protein